MNLTRCAALALRQTMLNILQNIPTAAFAHCTAPATVCACEGSISGTISYLPISPLSRETPVVWLVGEIASHAAGKLFRSPSSLSWIHLKWIHLRLGDELVAQQFALFVASVPPESTSRAVQKNNTKKKPHDR